MTRPGRSKRYEHLSDREVRERYVVAQLEWLCAHSWGNQVVMDLQKIIGRQLQAEMILRGLLDD